MVCAFILCDWSAVEDRLVGKACSVSEAMRAGDPEAQRIGETVGMLMLQVLSNDHLKTRSEFKRLA